MKAFVVALACLLLVGCEEKIAVIHEGEVIQGEPAQAKVQCNDPAQKDVAWCK
jgi:hypothetical protein